MKNILHWLWSILEVIIIVYAILITSFLLCRNKYGFTQFGDYTFENVNLVDERNIQGANKGDLLVVKNTNDIKVGDVIYYYAPFNENYIIRSDAVIAIEQDDYSALYTVHRGDADVTVASTRVLGKNPKVWPTIGGILDIVESRVGFLFLVLLPIMIVFIYQVYEFIVILRYEKIEEDTENEEIDDKVEKVQEKIANSKKKLELKEDIVDSSFDEKEDHQSARLDKFQLSNEETNEGKEGSSSTMKDSVDDRIKEEISRLNKENKSSIEEDEEIL